MDYDSPWKDVVEGFFEDLVGFFFPKVHAAIDWTVDPVSLEQELRQALPDALVGRRYVDKLVKLRTKQGDERYFHVEIQRRREDEFDKRMVQYNEKAEGKYKNPVVSVAILTDDDPAWRPGQYVFAQWGFTKTVKYPAVKVLDWRAREAELWDHANPFALFLLAHLIEQHTAKDEERQAAKLRLLLNLRERKLIAVDAEEWYRLIDWLLPLEEEAEGRLEKAFLTTTGELTMPYVSYADRKARERAEAEGRAAGRAEGLAEGRAERQTDTLRANLVTFLVGRFKAEGRALAESLPADLSIAQLEELINEVSTAESADAFRKAMA